MTMRRAHRLNALALAAFITLHLANHLTLLAGPGVHLAVMDALRVIYRPLLVETLLIVLFAVQIALGIKLAMRKPRAQGTWARAQRISGLILAAFLAQHIIAAIATRSLYDTIDTNVYWAAAVVSTTPHVWYFAPYYALGCASLFVHIAAVLHRRRPVLARAILVTGAVISTTIVASLIRVTDLPAPYVAYVQGYWGLR